MLSNAKILVCMCVNKFNPLPNKVLENNIEPRQFTIWRGNYKGGVKGKCTWNVAKANLSRKRRSSTNFFIWILITFRCMSNFSCTQTTTTAPIAHACSQIFCAKKNIIHAWGKTSITKRNAVLYEQCVKKGFRQQRQKLTLKQEISGARLTRYVEIGKGFTPRGSLWFPSANCMPRRSSQIICPGGRFTRSWIILTGAQRAYFTGTFSFAGLERGFRCVCLLRRL